MRHIPEMTLKRSVLVVIIAKRTWVPKLLKSSMNKTSKSLTILTWKVVVMNHHRQYHGPLTVAMATEAINWLFLNSVTFMPN